jgi:anti-sigma regulatory factor (Ser/Thr protein kinase)
MVKAAPMKVRVRFPGDLDYIPSIRKFVSELLIATQFSPKCAFRSEIIIDEICNNAVSYGCRSADSAVDLTCLFYSDHIEFEVKDTGGNAKDLGRLKEAMKMQEGIAGEVLDGKRSAKGLGLEIVRMLSEEVNLEVDDNNLTSIRVVRKREDARPGKPARKAR